MRWVLWWFAVFAAYVIEFVAQTASEIVAGTLIAGLCVPIVATALRNGDPDVRVRWRWLAHLRRVPMQMARDALMVSGRILWALRTGNDLVGFFIRVPYDCRDRHEAFTMGREAIVIAGVCAAPNTIVAEVDHRGELLIHQLVSRPYQAESEQWPL